MYKNLDIKSIVTPVNADVLERLLVKTGYDRQKIKKVVTGFRTGFKLGYNGPRKIQKKSPNLPFAVGDGIDLWNKVMKEVKLGRYAGPFNKVPFKHFIQSPIGLVPKDKGRDMRLIFHLSYPKNGSSINSEMPQELCAVRYPKFYDAIERCLQELQSSGRTLVYSAKSDLKSAFRILPLKVSEFMLVVMKAVSPIDGKTYFFVDKCLPFGASICCKLFQDFSDSLAHIQKVKSGKKPVNYLDDFYFVAYLKHLCNQQVQIFLELCNQIGFPVSLEKTEWATAVIVFLGILIDSKKCIVAVPLNKITKATQLVQEILSKRTVTVHRIQQLCGFLNFLCRCILPGRAFTRRLYALTQTKTKSTGQVKTLLPHHHITVTREAKMDLRIWLSFLQNQQVFCRPFLDCINTIDAQDIMFYTDSTANPDLGMGGICGPNWFIQRWNSQFIKQNNPSIQYLELYAVTTGILLWIRNFSNSQRIIYCDNQSAMNMINASSSSCKNCMVLIRIIVLECMMRNVKLTCHHVKSEHNVFTDSLSRGDIITFYSEIRKSKLKINAEPDAIPEQIWPMEKIWLD